MITANSINRDRLGPMVDLSGDTTRQTVIAAGSESVYQGHPTTLLMPDGKTLFCVWSYDHGGPCGPLKRSRDRGRTWSDLLEVPENWKHVRNCPVLYRLPDPKRGGHRLFVFAGQGPDGCIHASHSEDDGETWSPMRSLGLQAVMPFCTIIPIDQGRTLLGLSNIRRPAVGAEYDPGSNIVAQSLSRDGGITWSPWRVILDDPERRFCEPWLIPSPEQTGGRPAEWTCLLRENVYGRAYAITTRNEGESWSQARPLPDGLAGDRHISRYAPDGRLVVAFRDRGEADPHFVAWVGRYEALHGEGQGDYRIKLLHSHAGYDCGYPGLEVFEDGSLLATTYIKYRPGPAKHSIVSTRFSLAETDALGGIRRAPAPINPPLYQ